MGTQILLDMDGVLSNFVKAACEVHNRPYEPEKLTHFDMAACWGITAEEFWAPIKGADFWEGLEPYPWAEELLEELRKIAPVTICTAPSRDPHCGAGKLSWLRRELRVNSYDVVLCNKKWLLASPNNILVDDSEKKIISFREHGGYAVTFPQPWNYKRNHAGQWEDTVNTVRGIAAFCETGKS